MWQEIINLQNYKFSLHAIAPFTSTIFTLSLGAFIWNKNSKSRLHQTLSLFCFFSAIWQFSTAMMFMAKLDSASIFWDRVA